MKANTDGLDEIARRISEETDPNVNNCDMLDYFLIIHNSSPVIFYTHYTHYLFSLQGYKKETTNKYRL